MLTRLGAMPEILDPAEGAIINSGRAAARLMRKIEASLGAETMIPIRLADILTTSARCGVQRPRRKSEQGPGPPCGPPDSWPESESRCWATHLVRHLAVPSVSHNSVDHRAGSRRPQELRLARLPSNRSRQTPPGLRWPSWRSTSPGPAATLSGQRLAKATTGTIRRVLIGVPSGSRGRHDH